MTKFMLASDAVIEKIKFPCIVQPKIDGCRFGHLIGKPTGRSLKQHKNYYTNNFFDSEVFNGFDGEMACDQDQTHPDLCRVTSSALGTYEGQPFLKWWIFDVFNEHSYDLNYFDRYKLAIQKVNRLHRIYPGLLPHLEVVPSYACASLNDLLSYEEDFLELGYEGVIVRDPNAKYKQGRSTVREGGLLRIKRFIEAEARIIGLVEGETNNNEAQIDERGYTFRTSHKANKVGNGMIGSLIGLLLKNVYSPFDNKLLFAAGQTVTISPGSLTHDERKYYWENQEQIIGKISKFKLFPKGVKDKPRFPNHVCFRNEEDL